MSIFVDGDDLVSSELLEHGSEVVTYIRGGMVLTVDAVIGRTEFFGADSSSIHDRMESRDFLILASDLVSLTEPLEGDKISDGAGDWYVRVPDGIPKPWKFSDGTRTVMRVHCWQGYDS